MERTIGEPVDLMRGDDHGEIPAMRKSIFIITPAILIASTAIAYAQASGGGAGVGAAGAGGHAGGASGASVSSLKT